MGATLNMQFRLPFKLEREGDVFISICDVLDVRSKGTQQSRLERC